MLELRDSTCYKFNGVEGLTAAREVIAGVDKGLFPTLLIASTLK